MEIEFSQRALNDLSKWKKSGNTKVQQKISALSSAILENPFEGIGKPEPLKYEMSGLWSRRINYEDRYIYEVCEDVIIVHSLKGHYKP